MRLFARALIVSILVAVFAAGAVGGRGWSEVGVAAAPAPANQSDLSAAGKQVYDQIKNFALTGGSADVSGLTLKRDRVEMTFTGTFYFGAATGDRVTGAVFIGQGTMRAEAPPTDFEKENIKRLLNADLVESDFKTAVLRFSDDTMPLISANRKDGVTAPAAAQKLAAETDARVRQEIGANIPARLAASVVNSDAPGVFFAEFDGGRRGRFAYVLDHQNRIPVSSFSLTGGEKGIIFQCQNVPIDSTQILVSAFEVWMAFYAIDDYAGTSAVYSDTNDVIDVTGYRLNFDVRDLKLSVSAQMEIKARTANVRAASFNIGESLLSSTTHPGSRLTRQLRLKRARLGERDLAWVQEDWENGFTVFLPQAVPAGESFSLTVELSGNFLQATANPVTLYPLDNVTWLPRHGYLDRATFDLTFRHRRADEMVSVGTRLSKDPDPEDRNAMVTRYRMTHPVALVTFAFGAFDPKTREVTFEDGGKPIPVTFNLVRGQQANPDFFLGELDNAVRYFSAMFGPYPYETFSAAMHPFGFGQGFATLLMIAPAQRTGVNVRDSDVYAFLAHEAAHEWWGNIVAWRSYRDQWLSEGFAEYSGLLYAAKRGTDAQKTTMELLRGMRESLRGAPRTTSGAGKGRLNDIGPIVLGLRLNTSRTVGAYQTLIYSKGALVLRMLHFLMSNPANGNDALFFAMMKDFVEQNRNASATTEQFRKVASQHFARTPIAQKFGMTDLDWFFKQWVYGTGLPIYQLEYEVKPNPAGGLLLSGVVKQDGVGPDFQMVLPLVMTFEGNQEARTTVRAAGPSTPFELKLPAMPKKVELDPFSWVLSEKTTSRSK